MTWAQVLLDGPSALQRAKQPNYGFSTLIMHFNYLGSFVTSSKNSHFLKGGETKGFIGKQKDFSVRMRQFKPRADKMFLMTAVNQLGGVEENNITQN